MSRQVLLALSAILIAVGSVNSYEVLNQTGVVLNRDISTVAFGNDFAFRFFKVAAASKEDEELIDYDGYDKKQCIVDSGLLWESMKAKQEWGLRCK